MLKIEEVLKREGFNVIAGIDESGRGPVAGPVVASAVILKDLFFSVAIKDGKKLTSLARSKAFGEILKRSHVGIGIVDRDDIDKLNIYKASLLAMKEAVCSLKIKPDCLLIDGPYRISVTSSRDEDESVKNVSIINGEAHSLSIACASIVAKVVRDKIMEKIDELYPEYDFKHNKGYCTQKHLEAIEKFGPCLAHRLSFFPFAQKER
jgi:ribonuclease HII